MYNKTSPTANYLSRSDHRRETTAEYFDDPGFNLDDESLDTDLDIAGRFT